MIGPREQTAVRDLAVWYICEAKTEAELLALGDEIAFLKREVPLRTVDTEYIKLHWIRRRKEIS